VKKSVRQIQRARRAYFSQSGEDGALSYILSKIPNKDNWLVEFGAWDGKHLSNCYQFVLKHDYHGVFIEMDLERFLELQINMSQFGDRCVCMKEIVGFEGENGLDAILARTDVPREFDLLSIDIDSNDYQVWKALEEYKPKVVIIEINNRLPPGEYRINVPGSPLVLGESGSSISAINDLARTKGYSLISMIGCNAIFVRSEFLPYFHNREVTPSDVFTFEGNPRRELALRQKWRKFEVLALGEFGRRF